MTNIKQKISFTLLTGILCLSANAMQNDSGNKRPNPIITSDRNSQINGGNSPQQQTQFSPNILAYTSVTPQQTPSTSQEYCLFPPQRQLSPLRELFLQRTQSPSVQSQHQRRYPQQQISSSLFSQNPFCQRPPSPLDLPITHPSSIDFFGYDKLIDPRHIIINPGQIKPEPDTFFLVNFNHTTSKTIPFDVCEEFFLNNPKIAYIIIPSGEVIFADQNDITNILYLPLTHVPSNEKQIPYGYLCHIYYNPPQFYETNTKITNEEPCVDIIDDTDQVAQETLDFPTVAETPTIGNQRVHEEVMPGEQRREPTEESESPKHKKQKFADDCASPNNRQRKMNSGILPWDSESTYIKKNLEGGAIREAILKQKKKYDHNLTKEQLGNVVWTHCFFHLIDEYIKPIAFTEQGSYENRDTLKIPVLVYKWTKDTYRDNGAPTQYRGFAEYGRKYRMKDAKTSCKLVHRYINIVEQDIQQYPCANEHTVRYLNYVQNINTIELMNNMIELMNNMKKETSSSVKVYKWGVRLYDRKNFIIVDFLNYKTPRQ